jgi:multimeric flavodoxin WrbA
MGNKLKVKIMGISCAHRKGRNTSWLTLFALKAAEKFGRRIAEIADIETTFIDLCDFRKKQISPVAICKKRNGYYESSVKDYTTNELMSQMAEADGFVFGSPVYTGAPTSRFITLIEHLRAGVKNGCFTDKPMGGVSVATMSTGGQDRCLEYMEDCTRSLGMIPVHALFGCAGVSGVPYGPLVGDDDGTIISCKNDRFAQWSAILTGRRVAEVAVIQKMAKRRLGKLYDSEFIQRYHLPFGNESWAWTDLDREDQDLMLNLDDAKISALDQTILSKPPVIGEGGVKCKILGLGCDDYKGIDTNWLVINSLKAIEKFGRKIAPIGSFETEFINLTDKDIKPCLSCDHYNDIPNGGHPWIGSDYPDHDSFGCIQKKDYFTKEFLPKWAEADGVIFGSSVCAFAPSVTFRLLNERLVAGIWKGYNNLKPSTSIAVSYDKEKGQEACLNVMNTINRWYESIPVSWPHGTTAQGGSLDLQQVVVKDDTEACALSVINARRLAEFALQYKLAKEELGDLYKKEFYQVVHPPHGEAPWEWSRIDKEDEEYMRKLDPKTLAKLNKL